MAWVCHSNFCALACVHSCFPLDQAAQRRSPESKQLFTLPSCVRRLTRSFFLQADPNILKLPQTRWRGPEREARGNSRSWCLSPVTKAPGRARSAMLAEATPAGASKAAARTPPCEPGGAPWLRTLHSGGRGQHRGPGGSGRHQPRAGGARPDRALLRCGTGRRSRPRRSLQPPQGGRREGRLAELSAPFPRRDQGPSASPRPAKAAAVLRLIWLTESLQDFGWGGRKLSLEGAGGWLWGSSLEVLWEHKIESGKWVRDPPGKEEAWAAHASVGQPARSLGVPDGHLEAIHSAWYWVLMLGLCLLGRARDDCFSKWGVGVAYALWPFTVERRNRKLTAGDLDFVKKACLGIALCVLPTDAVRPPGPMPVFYAMKMFYMHIVLKSL